MYIIIFSGEETYLDDWIPEVVKLVKILLSVSVTS